MLPPLSPVERAHSRQVAERILAEIRAAGGWVSFERFMELALYAPGLGYYSAGSAKLGTGGDFVTAPEVSDLFGRCLARQCAAVLRGSGGEILELGAGTGRMAAALLTELALLGVLPARYAILEVSADLAARQRARLSQLPRALSERVAWLTTLPPTPVRGVILANEVADALSCRRFTWRATGLMEVGVTESRITEVGVAPGEPAANGAPEITFRERAVPAGADLTRAVEAIVADLREPLPEDYTSEACLRLAPWIASLSDCLEQGMLLLCDYGLPRRHYYHPQRRTGTLRCHFRQRAHDDPYLYVGLQDITAWVDFTRVAEAASAAGLTVAGFATQAACLGGLGLAELVTQATDDVQRARLAGEARRLILPQEMGEAFKMMALTRDFEAPLAAFALQDLRHLL